jgi:hypothetical protein
MKLVVRLLIIAALCPIAIQAEDLTDEKKAAIRELMTVSGGTKIGPMMSDYVVRALLETLQKDDSSLTPEQISTIANEVSAFMSEEMSDSGSYWDMVCPIYGKYFTLDEIRQTTSFYETEIGQKWIEVMPTMMQEVMSSAKAWSESLQVPLTLRIAARLEAMGKADTAATTQ